jgi:hypothetical protein
MYDINLIKEKIVPDSRRKVVVSIISLATIGFVVALAAVGLLTVANMRMSDVYAHEIDRFEEELTAIYPGAPSPAGLSKLMDDVKPDLSQVAGVLQRTSGATMVLESLNQALPDSVWITRVRIACADGSVANHGRNSRKGAGDGLGTIVIEGMALVGENSGGDMALRRFAKNLERHESLSEILSNVECSETGITRIGDVPVIGFETICRFRG